MTVNKALTQLAKAGLIERRKKSGSFVVPCRRRNRPCWRSTTSLPR